MAKVKCSYHKYSLGLGLDTKMSLNLTLVLCDGNDTGQMWLKLHFDTAVR